MQYYNGLPPQRGSSPLDAHYANAPPPSLPNPHEQQPYPPQQHQFYPITNHQPNDGYYPQSHHVPPMTNGYPQPPESMHYQNYQPHASSSYHYAPNPAPVPSVEAVPPPTLKVSYDAPVFQTFQERKRAKEMALRAKVGEASTPPPRATPSPSVYPQPHVQPIPQHRSPSPLQHQHPSASTLAMMGQQSPSTGPPPVPPSRSRSPAPSSVSMNGPQGFQQPLPNSSSRPLPPPRALPSFPVVGAGSTPSPTVTPSPRPSNFNNMPPPPVPSPIQADLERSDTVSSVKSLDRMGFSSSPVRRSLPKPPVGVNSSKSLDRGIPSSVGMGMGDGFRKNMNRKQPSVVEEGNEASLVNGMAGISLDRQRTPSPSHSNTPSVPPIRTPSPSPLPSITPPIVFTPNQSSDNRTPAKFTPLPAINFPDSDTSSIATTDDENDNQIQNDNQATPKTKKTSNGSSSPGIQFSGLPVISVSSSDTADEPSQGGEISFSVPTINFDNDTPAIHVPVISVPPPTASSSRPQQNRVQPNGSAILCSGCANPIIGRIVNAMNQRWHPQCFMCAECGELLEHVSSYEWEGKAYCHLDFHDKFAHKCHHCQTPIVDHRFVTLNDPILGQRYYHELHFFCSECGDPFLDPSKSSAPGTEKIRQGDGEEEEEEEGETSAFVIQKGHPYCEKCHLRLHKPKCHACKQPIPDLAINAMGVKWHKECFVCTQCHNEFANNLFFPKEGKAFCTSCYEDIIASE